MKTKSNSPENFATILENYKRLIFKVAGVYCRDPENRKDLVQEIVLQIWRSLPSYNEKFAMSTWIYRIALNVSISHYRKETTRQKTYNAYQHNMDIVEVESDKDLEDKTERLYGIIDNLRPIDKAIIVLYLENRSHAEIADIMGISVTNVSTKINRIKNMISRDFKTKKDY